MERTGVGGWTPADEQLFSALRLARALDGGWRPEDASRRRGDDRTDETLYWSVEKCEIWVLTGEPLAFHTLGTKPGGAGISYVVTPSVNYLVNRRLERNARKKWLAASHWEHVSTATLHLTSHGIEIDAGEEVLTLPCRNVTAVARKPGGVVVEASEARDWLPKLQRAFLGKPEVLEHEMETWLGIRSGMDDWLMVAMTLVASGEVWMPQVPAAFYERASASGRRLADPPPPTERVVAGVQRAVKKAWWGKSVPWERTLTDRKIAGVAGGMARRYNVNPALVRAFWILAASPIGLFMGIPFYLAFWIFVPVERPGRPRPQVKVAARREPPDANLTEIPDLPLRDASSSLV
ncbi:MAG TPA: PspC domain-containing protein [Actinomycetota bacterium]|nr:PspC domain-containing protein [Actinomycetota bacterium]